jgi:hypothetical protein
MNRITVSQALLDTMPGAVYLEIGVDNGSSFIPIRARRKWGVDPSITISRKRRAKYALFSALRLKVERLFDMPSDDFFASYEPMLRSHGIDVCFVDGLHTYEQALRDVVNALKYLKPGGVILVHDCNPVSEIMGCPAESINELIRRGIPGWDGAWSGDVWKAIVHLRSRHQDLRAFVLDCDTGVGIVTRGAAAATLPYTEAEIRAMGYATLDADRARMLDLRPPDYFETFLRQHVQETRRRG